MSISFVSSMNKRLYEQYGKRFMQEFSEFASADLKLFVIFEGDYPEEAIKISNNVIIVPLMSSHHEIFLKYFGHLLEPKGFKTRLFNENGVEKIQITPDYKYNAIRFSFKPFSIYQALDYIPLTTERLIWIDADLRCKKIFNEKSLEKFLPSYDELMSYLGRKDNYSECGFLGFNIKHEKFKIFIERVIQIYKSGEIFSLKEWHDSWIWDFVRKEFENLNITFKNISGKGFAHYHPFINSGLEEYFDHLKGPKRKANGNSFKDDYQ